MTYDRLYITERKPIAQANTDLSMENYEKSASVARMLGVDPVLAKIAIDTAKSSFSSLMPLSMRKVVVNTILDVGLSTLALLARPGVVLGDVRVGMVKRTVDKKQSLPLIFPAADIDFDYSVKATSTTSSSSKSMAQRIFGSPSVLKEFTAPLLREGGRVPHCWFFSPSELSPLGGYSPHEESTANSSVDRSKPNQDRIQDLTDDQSITSSVSLSAFLNSNRMANATDPGSLIPKVMQKHLKELYILLSFS